MYWAGTIKYEMVKGGVNTVSCYTDDLRFAIRLVRIRMKLYKPGDSRFTEDVRPPPVVTPPQGENLNPVEVSLLCTGSGFFVTANGYLLTNNHVVQGGKSYKVLMSDGLAEANLVKTDPETDLALLKVEKKVAACAFSSNRKERLGNDIFTLGFPQPDLQGFSPKVTKGVISGVDGFQGNVHEYQIDASIQPGNSGGPLFDMKGHVVGVVVASLKKGQIVNYAIKKAYVMAFLDSIGSCSDGVVVGDDNCASQELSTVVDRVRDSCALILTYK